jgi:hypothetical protein
MLCSITLTVVSWTDDDPAEEDDDDDEFHYPGSSPPGTRRSSSIRSFSTDYFGQQPTSRTPTDLTPHLSQAPEFRVPTHEAPQKVVAPKYTPPTPHELHARWERDHLVQNCRDCQRRFSFILRRVCLLLPIFYETVINTLSST